MRQEKILFANILQQDSLFWKFSGMYINYDRQPKKQSILRYIYEHRLYSASFFFLNIGVISVISTIHLLTMEEILYMVPCLVICVLGDIKSFYFLNYENVVFDIINTLRTLQSIDEEASEGKEEVLNEYLKKRLSVLKTANYLLIVICATGIATFLIGPLIITSLQYLSTNEIMLFLPYKIWYPFDVRKVKGWFYAYIHQFWSAWTAVFYIYGPDRFFYTACAFAHNQFCSLKYDMERIGPKSFTRDDSLTQNIDVLVHRHRELMRCVDMLNLIYGKSTLFNVLSSSFIICFAGFNVTSIENLIMMVPFAAVMFFGSIQIYLICYYGDMLMRASMEISDAIFNSPHWYEMDAASMKCCLFILMRAQKPCKIKAFGFREINLMTFSKILSSAWSYFTILNTMYSK